MATAVVDYLPIATTGLAVVFTAILAAHWRRTRSRHLLWWTVGVAMYGLGTLSEAVVTLGGWEPWLFRSWYISGALLGGAPLAQGTVYLLHKRRTADRMAAALVLVVAVAATVVLLTPVTPLASDPDRLTGEVMHWSWVRAVTPFVNVYAVVYLVGGAAWSAVRYRRTGAGTAQRVWGNVLIAVGALLPGIGGTFTRFGRVEVLYVTELIGLALIYSGYRVMVSNRADSIHRTQREVGAAH